MKTPEPFRSHLSKPPEAPPAGEERKEKEKEQKVLPRYVELPALREHGLGPRNLFWGVVTFVLAMILLVLALFFAGPRATLSLGTTLLTFMALFVLARLHIFRQRNGGFLAVAVVCLIGALIPLVERGFEAAQAKVAQRAATAPAVVQTRIPEAEMPLPATSVLAEKPQPASKEVASAELPAEPAPTAPPQPSADELAEITFSAQREAVRRYPALGIKDSLENAAFVSTYKQLKDAGSNDFFANPEWPMELAELLAKREGWARGGAPMTTGPAPVLDPPNDSLTPSPSVTDLDAGAGLPGAPR